MSLKLLGTGTHGSSPVFKSFQDSDFKITLSSVQHPISTGGSTSNNTTNGRVFHVTTAPTSIVQNLQLTPAFVGSLANQRIPACTWVSSNTAICTVDNKGFVTYVSNGTATIYCTSDVPKCMVAFTFTFTSTGGGSTSVFMNWAVVSPVSLPAHLNSQVDGLISGAGSFLASKMNLYSLATDSSSTYLRNASLWAGLDFSGVAAWNVGANSVYFLATLISPTDIAFAHHTNIVAGAIFRFVDPSNSVFTATVTAVSNISGDLSVGHIAWAGGVTPTTLKFYKVLPSNYINYWPDHVPNFFPALFTNQSRQVFVQDSNQAADGSTSAFNGQLFMHTPSLGTTRAPWSKTVIGGDSGNPVFAVINGELILLCCNYSANFGPHMADHITAINSALSSMGSTHTLTTPNMTTPIAFPTY